MGHRANMVPVESLVFPDCLDYLVTLAVQAILEKKANLVRLVLLAFKGHLEKLAYLDSRVNVVIKDHP